MQRESSFEEGLAVERCQCRCNGLGYAAFAKVINAAGYVDGVGNSAIAARAHKSGEAIPLPRDHSQS